MVKLVQEEDLQLDVVSEGELYTALEESLTQVRSTSMGITKPNVKYNTL